MSEFQRKNLVYEKEDLLVTGEGKYPGYDFYAVAGVRPGKAGVETDAAAAKGRRSPADPGASCHEGKEAMNVLLAIAAFVAVVSTLAVILQRTAVHALLYLIVSFFALAVAMLALGAAFAAALEVVVYAGAILVLFVFVVMMIGSEGPLPGSKAWIGPALLSIVLLGELAYVFVARPGLLAPMAGSRGRFDSSQGRRHGPLRTLCHLRGDSRLPPPLRPRRRLPSRVGAPDDEERKSRRRRRRGLGMNARASSSPSAWPPSFSSSASRA